MPFIICSWCSCSFIFPTTPPIFEWAHSDLNRGPPPYQSGVLAKLNYGPESNKRLGADSNCRPDGYFPALAGSPECSEDNSHPLHLLLRRLPTSKLPRQ